MSGDYIDLPQVLAAAGTVRLPGSKSISNRMLLLAALAAGKTEICDLLHADDTARMLDALHALGVDIESGEGNRLLISGVNGNITWLNVRWDVDWNPAYTCTPQ